MTKTLIQALTGAAVGLFLLYAAYTQGSLDTMAATKVVAFGLRSNGYGPYFGECLPLEGRVFCATDRNDKQWRPEGGCTGPACHAYTPGEACTGPTVSGAFECKRPQ